MIPQSYQDSITRVMYAIHNMPASLLKDTILNLFGFSNFSTYPFYEVDSFHIQNALLFPALYNASSSLKRFKIIIPDTTSWAVEWQSGNYTNTSNPGINTLALQYRITALSVTNTFGNNYLIEANVPLAVNIPALFKLFDQVLGRTNTCSPNSYAGDGNRIYLSYQADGIVITYQNSCGDCPAGCTWGRKWMFKVFYNNCLVEYLGAANWGTGTNPYNPNSSVYSCTRGPVLPIAFGNISGWLQSGQAIVNWKVLTQTNVREYIIEKSDNGSTFYQAGTIQSNGQAVADYTWKDLQPINGTAWYRIKAIDVDGRAKYSAAVKIASNRNAGITVYPNPVKDHKLIIQFGATLSGKASVNLYGMNGRRVWLENINLVSQATSRSFNLPASLSGGTYSLVVNTSAKNFQQTVVISGN